MELVYLWVKKYKNIENQGFNFSPRFECEYKDGTLTICDKKKKECKDNNYIENFFGENINVTAIVGENGSGKSSVLEALSDLLSDSYSLKNFVQGEEYRKYILVYKYDCKYYYLASHIQEEINITDKFQNKLDWIAPNPNKDYLLSWHSDLITLVIDNQLKHKKVYRDYNRVFTESIQSDTTRIKKIIVNNLLGYKDTIFKKDTEKFFVPQKIAIKIKNYNLFVKDKEYYEDNVWSEIGILKTAIEDNLKEQRYQDAFFNVTNVIKLKQTKHKKVSFMEAGFGNDRAKDMIYFSDTYKYTSKLERDGYNVDDIYSQILQNLPVKTLPKNIFYEWTIDKLDEKMVDFIFDLPEIAFYIELFDNKKSFDSLSYGETQILSQLNFILFHSRKKVYTDEVTEIIEDENQQKHEINRNIDFQINNMIVLLDEFELGLHPNWQKKSILYLIDFLKLFDTNFHIIITSHSPFILSDLPKENVIFLKDGKQDSPDIKQTFGANIHTLLSHGFFMKDGLMGEFAKGKIEDVINYLNDKESTIKDNDEAQKLLNIIGEPIIKNQLQRMLDSKRLSKVDEIDKIKSDMKNLAKRLEELEK